MMASQTSSSTGKIGPMTYVTRREIEAAEAQAVSSTLKADRRFLWLWLTISTLLSVAGNVGHAWLTVPSGTAQYLAIGWACAPPILLMLAVHGLPTLSRMLGSDRSDTLLSLVVWGVVAVTFGWSAFGIYGFTTALGIPASLSWVAPLGVDLSVFGATRGLVLTAPIAARMKVGAPAQRAAQPQVSKPVAPTPAPRQAASTGSSAAPVAPRPTTPPVTPRPASSNAPQGSPGAANSAPEITALAERIVSSERLRTDAATVAKILALAETESRKNVIERQLGVHHGVITKVLAAAERERPHSLVAVS